MYAIRKGLVRQGDGPAFEGTHFEKPGLCRVAGARVQAMMIIQFSQTLLMLMRSRIVNDVVSLSGMINEDVRESQRIEKLTPEVVH